MQAQAPLLITGFEPFDGDSINSSWLLAQALADSPLQGCAVVARQLPVSFGRSLAALTEAVQQVRPQLVLAMGQAANRDVLSFERVALNLIDARIPDNDGVQPIDSPVVPRSPSAYFSTLPLKTMVRAAQAVGVPAELSLTAGSYVCNQVFYGLQHRLRRNAAVRSGFLHVPALSGPQPPLRLEVMVAGVRAALTAALNTPDGADLALSAGFES
ncbi:pyroglutamyl-peptidase I [Inhella gelatinilytica]|uniref:Pyroglutamyl-peptidase I n=1 Tax=Inhella gelatinilytica TaxID=2795030 RepID=A0A931NFJ2_9BURK|nr:pyroglutamyl-peptidase I [Inhella gelatinilytica]MBH9553611.1 pyroglutamyl-peptidase I [Inhella gelatinilytica]